MGTRLSVRLEAGQARPRLRSRALLAAAAFSMACSAAPSLHAESRAVLETADMGHPSQSCRAAEPWRLLSATGSNFARPWPLTLTALAVVAPFGFVPTGLDQGLREASQRDLGGRPDLEPVSVLTPYVLAGGLLVGYGAGRIAGSCRTQQSIAPLLQAGALSYVGIGVLKFAVGRRFPNGGRDPDADDRLDHPERARDFTPFQRGFGAWPSGHTSIMFALAAAFRGSNPELAWVSYLGYPLAVAVAGGMWLGDHHYASDILSGALFGEAIGTSVGTSFRAGRAAPIAVQLVPQGQTGFSVVAFGVW